MDNPLPSLNSARRFLNGRRDLFLIVSLIVIIVSFFLVLQYIGAPTELPPATPPPSGRLTFSPDMSVAEKKAALLRRVSRAASLPLSEQEKVLIFNELGGERAALYNLTRVEKERIKEAFNVKSR